MMAPEDGADPATSIIRRLSYATAIVTGGEP
jgi:hypothetical protein